MQPDFKTPERIMANSLRDNFLHYNGFLQVPKAFYTRTKVFLINFKG